MLRDNDLSPISIQKLSAQYNWRLGLKIEKVDHFKSLTVCTGDLGGLENMQHCFLELFHTSNQSNCHHLHIRVLIYSLQFEDGN